MIGLDIGCGENKKPDMIGLDHRKTVSTDIIADARTLPFKEESFDYLFSSHVIEHFSHREVSEIIANWVRILKKGGTIEVRCPDLRARAFIFFINPTWQNIVNIYGGQDFLGNCHQSGFSFGLLKHLLESCGIYNIKRILNYKGYKGIPFMPEDLYVRGIKR